MFEFLGQLDLWTCICIVIGAGIIIIGVIAAYKTIKERRKIRESGITVEGVVFDIRIEQSNDSDGYSSTYYYPVVRYQTLEKEWITERYYIGREAGYYREGDAVIIIYDRDEPRKFILEGKVKQKW